MRLVLSIIVSLLFVTPVTAQSFDICDNKIDVENGEKPGGPFFGLGYSMLAFAYAEKHCGATPPIITNTFQEYLKRNGCNEGTEIFTKITTTLKKIENATVKDLITEGDPSIKLSYEEVNTYAEQAVSLFGGCQSLLKMHAFAAENGIPLRSEKEN